MATDRVQTSPTRPERDPGRHSNSRWVFLAFIGFSAVLLGLEHRAHLAGILPWLILAACPLMHLFMHRRDHGQAGHKRDEP